MGNPVQISQGTQSARNLLIPLMIPALSLRLCEAQMISAFRSLNSLPSSCNNGDNTDNELLYVNNTNTAPAAPAVFILSDKGSLMIKQLISPFAVKYVCRQYNLQRGLLLVYCKALLPCAGIQLCIFLMQCMQ